MIKKVASEALQPGRHIERFDGSWLKRPFPFNRTRIKPLTVPGIA